MKMISYHDGHPWIHEQPPLQAVCGRGMDELMLNGADFAQLCELPPAQLKTWVESMITRFNHVPESPAEP